MNNDLVPGFNDEKDDSLKIQLDKVEDVENCLMVILNGYIDTYNSVYFQKQIGKIVSAGFVNLIFNCASLNYVSSTGIGSFTAFLKLVKPAQGWVLGAPSGAMPQKSKNSWPFALASMMSSIVRIPVAWSALPCSD